MPMRVIRANLADHPAVRAWRRLGGGRAEPDRVEILKEVVHDERCDLDPFPAEGTNRYSVLELSPSRSAVYRLVGVGPGGSAVVAKQCYQKHSESAVTEHVIYERVLPRLPVAETAATIGPRSARSVRYFGAPPSSCA